MRVNGRGDVVGRDAINGVLAPIGLPGVLDKGCWFDDDTAVFQLCDGTACRLVAWGRLVAWDVPSQTAAEIDPQGANWLSAGHRLLAARIDSGLYTVRTNWAQRYDNARIGEVSPDGDLAICTDNRDGIGLAVYARGGALLRAIPDSGVLVDDAVAGLCVRLRDGRLCWSGDQVWRFDPPIAGYVARTERLFTVVPVLVDGVTWLYEQADVRVSLRRADSALGYILQDTPGANAFAGDVRAIGAGRLMIAWSMGAAQLADEAVRVEIDLLARMWRTAIGASAFTAWHDLPPASDLNAAPIPSVTIGAFTHLHHQAAFKGVSNFGSFVTPCEAEILEHDWSHMPAPKPVFAPVLVEYDGVVIPVASTVPRAWLRGVFVSTEAGQPVDEVEWAAAVALARDRGVPIIWNLDAVLWRDQHALLEAHQPAGVEVVPMKELYPSKVGGVVTPIVETVASWHEDLRFLAARGSRLAVVVSLYTQSDNFPIAHVMALTPYAADLIREFRPMLVGFFSWARPSGVLTYPDALLPIVQQFVAGRPDGEPARLELPVPVPTPPPAPPPIPPTRPSVPPEETDMATPIVLNGAELDTYFDDRGKEVHAVFAARGIVLSDADARQRAREANQAIQAQCQAQKVPMRMATPEQVLTLTELYLYQRDTPESRQRMDTYARDSVRLRG